MSIRSMISGPRQRLPDGSNDTFISHPRTSGSGAGSRFGSGDGRPDFCFDTALDKKLDCSSVYCRGLCLQPLADSAKPLVT